MSRLIGAPPGYVGDDEGGQLTEAVRRKPYSVILFDEIEKAHPDVFNILLQVLDDGRLTDNKGRVVNFKNTIIIMTSNLGSRFVQERMADMEGKSRAEADRIMEQTRQKVLEMLKQNIRPEFINRIDDIILFRPLTRSQADDIVRLQVVAVNKNLKENGLTLRVSDQAIHLLGEWGYDPEFGARPIKRAIQRYLLNDLSRAILGDATLDRTRPIVADVADGKIVFRQDNA